jgi:hypothetical protein
MPPLKHITFVALSIRLSTTAQCEAAKPFLTVNVTVIATKPKDI